METLKRLGIFGGSFDPIHRAHLKLAEQALTQYSLDQVWFVPSGISYHKGHEMTPAGHRVAMVKLAIVREPRFVFSDLDIAREGNTYTADTLAFLKESMPDTELFFLVGADSLMNMENWYRPEAIFSAAHILAAGRPGNPESELHDKAEDLRKRFGARISWLDAGYTDISSSQIREAIRQGKDLSGFVLPEVEAYICEHGLYQGTGRWTAEEILADLKQRLKPGRFAHTLGVADTAKRLAAHYGAEEDKAYLSGVLHDCAKYLSGDEQIRRARMAGIALTDSELRCPALIHAKLGAYYARERYGIGDEDILNAIRYHTTGRPGMSLLECILYIADYVEPGRKEAPHLEELRRLAFQNLEETVYRISEDTVAYLEGIGSVIDEASRRTGDYYRNMIRKES
jgi:nicotinate-nucleotide adenylyltransferase